jgi:hypothetical protein
VVSCNSFFNHSLLRQDMAVAGELGRQLILTYAVQIPYLFTKSLSPYDYVTNRKQEQTQEVKQHI